MNIRLDKFLSNRGVASRRGVDIVLKRGWVRVNGVVVYEPGIRIDPEKDIVEIRGKKLRQPCFEYYALNKPKGVISTALDEKGRESVVSLIRSKERLYPVGRLDKNTTGLILLTNDGELANKLTHPRYHVEKKYELIIDGLVTKKQIEKFKNGVDLEDGKTAPAHLKILSTNEKNTILQATLYEGRKRQIRRMCKTLGMRLVDLKRVQIGPLHIGKLKLGQYRKLTSKEIALLKKQSSL